MTNLQNISGQEISFNACVLDYYDLPAKPTQFVLSSEDQYQRIIGSENHVPFEEFSIKGKGVLGAINYSINITSY